MRWRWTAVACALLSVALLACAGCTSSKGGSPSSSPSLPASSGSSSVSVPVSSVPVTASTSQSGPPRPTQPTLPADVPTAGPNMNPGEKPPIMALEATQHTPEGAKAFAEFFIKTIDWGYATLSSTYMRHYFQRSCVGCQSFASTIDKDRRAHYRYYGGRLTVKGVTAGSDNADRTVTVVVSGTSREVVTSKGKYVRGDPAYPTLRLVSSLRWESSEWTVASIGVMA